MSPVAEEMTVDIAQMRLETGIPTDEIEAALQQSKLRPEDIASFDKAAEAFQKRLNTPEEGPVLRRMIELANTVEKIVFAYKCIPKDSPGRTIIIRKAAAFFITP